MIAKEVIEDSRIVEGDNNHTRHSRITTTKPTNRFSVSCGLGLASESEVGAMRIFWQPAMSVLKTISPQ